VNRFACWDDVVAFALPLPDTFRQTAHCEGCEWWDRASRVQREAFGDRP
jgi:hypothetical protein